jgi:hypothetical protein
MRFLTKRSRVWPLRPDAAALPAAGFSSFLERMVRSLILFLAVLFVGRTAWAEEIPASELANAPSAERVAALQTEAAKAGWPAVAQQLRRVAVGLYEKQGAPAQAWYGLYRWADLFGQTEAQAVTQWMEAVKRAKAAHANMPVDVRMRLDLLAGLWPPELRTYAMTSPEFSAQFFAVYTPYDQPSMVMSILAALWQRDPAEFKDYANLAIAIAVVYDVPPPPDWPHGQVSPEALPRKLLPPVEVFSYFVKADRAGDTLQHLRKLSAAELKFVVDTGAAFDEMAWAQKSFRMPLAQLANVSLLVPARPERVAGGALIWPQATYRLPDILKTGGIRVDQAYFAAMVGKARGVPTMLFRGAGLDGRHAWFGFLDNLGRWQFNCGRSAEEQAMPGYAFDPQTWTTLPNYELAFLGEGFRRLPGFRTSQMHLQFAELYFYAGDFPAAAKAARSAIKSESRNLDAWYLLIASQERLGAGPRPVEGLLHAAAVAFHRYTDIEAGFKSRLASSLRARGQASAADTSERGPAAKPGVNQEELGIRQAQEIMLRSMETDSQQDRIRTYFKVLSSHGHGAGLAFFDQIVEPFVEYLLKEDQPLLAQRAIGQARSTLNVGPNTLLDAKLNALAERAQQQAPH